MVLSMISTYRVVVTYATVRDAPDGRVGLVRLNRRDRFDGYTAGHGWVARCDGGYVRASAVTIEGPAVRTVQTGPNGLGDAVTRLAFFLMPGGQDALSDYAAEVTGRCAAQTASVLVGLAERVVALETEVAALRALLDK